MQYPQQQRPAAPMRPPTPARPHLPPRPRARQRSWTPLVFMASIAALLLMTVCAALAGGYAYRSMNRIPSGVNVAGVLVGGKSVAEAEQLLAQNPPHQSLVLQDQSRHWTVALGDLGIAVDPHTSALAAMEAGRGATIQPRYYIDLNLTQQGLVNLTEVVNVAAIPGDNPQVGRSLEIPVLLERLRVDATGELADGILELPMIEIQPPREEAPNFSPDQTTVHVVARGEELGLIAKTYGVTVQDIVDLNSISDPNIINVGAELIIPAVGVYVPDAASAPPAPTQAGKAIVVSTREQRIYAYENGQLIRSHLTSTGLPATPTVLGDYNIYVKFRATDMSGEDYYLPQVPYTMYFYQGYGIHGTYWHNNFGRPMSHGCVNLPISEAEWFFNWAEVGTLVRVI